MLLKLLSLNKPVIIRARKGVFQGQWGGIVPEMPITGLLVPCSYTYGHWLRQNTGGWSKLTTTLPCALLLLHSRVKGNPVAPTITSWFLCIWILTSKFYIVNMGTLSKQMLVRKCLQKEGSQTSCRGDSSIIIFSKAEESMTSYWGGRKAESSEISCFPLESVLIFWNTNNNLLHVQQIQPPLVREGSLLLK